MNVPCRWIEPSELLSNSRDLQVDLRHSFGPCLAIRHLGYVLDAGPAGLRTVLGFNASPLFGALHLADVWMNSGQSTELPRLESAYVILQSRLGERLGERLCDCRMIRPLIELQPGTCTPLQLARSYIQASMLEQFSDLIQSLQQELQQRMASITEKHADLISECLIDGTSIRLTFVDPSVLEKVWQRRFEVGLNFEQCGDRVAVFHLNLSYRTQQLEWFWDRLIRLLVMSDGATTNPNASSLARPATVDYSYAFAERCLAVRTAPNEREADQVVLQYLADDLSSLALDLTLRPFILDRESYPTFRDQILQLQGVVYEPARQTPASEFDAIFNSEGPVALLILEGQRIVGMALAGPISLFGEVRGNATDPFGRDANTLYMVDVTVLPDFRGGMGRLLKSNLSLLAMLKGYSAIHGRNRDRLARGMWAINLSLGSYEIQHLTDDYPDQGEFRDCLYYRCPLAWPPEIEPGTNPTDSHRIAEMVNGTGAVVLD